jgi:hypothetical protein
MVARTPNHVIAAAEDSTAILLNGQDSLRELWLFLRSQERRGKFDPDDAAAAQSDLARVRRAIEEGLRLAHALRANPLGERGGGDGG